MQLLMNITPAIWIMGSAQWNLNHSDSGVQERRIAQVREIHSNSDQSDWLINVFWQNMEGFMFKLTFLKHILVTSVMGLDERNNFFRLQIWLSKM
jgi:hypothetical protein